MRYPPQPKVECPWCGYKTISRVIRSEEDRRLRLCSECGDTFPTIERPDVRQRKPKHRPRQPTLPFVVEKLV